MNNNITFEPSPFKGGSISKEKLKAAVAGLKTYKNLTEDSVVKELEGALGLGGMDTFFNKTLDICRESALDEVLALIDEL